eukprot:1160911-Pelagomonas_calceolata.AAC.13
MGGGSRESLLADWCKCINGHCNLSELQDLQDEKHAPFLCNGASNCALRNKYAHLFFQTSPQTRVSLGPTETSRLSIQTNIGQIKEKEKRSNIGQPG